MQLRDLSCDTCHEQPFRRDVETRFELPWMLWYRQQFKWLVLYIAHQGCQTDLSCPSLLQVACSRTIHTQNELRLGFGGLLG